jgi:1,4-dihydroxy-2-naphthoate octaprenyltransferase
MATTTTDSVRARARPYLRVARVPFLALPVTLVALAMAAAAVAGTVDPVRTGVALIGLLAAHVAVNAFNEVSDYERGIDQRTDRTPFSGGSGALPEGDADSDGARRLGYVSAGVAAAVGAWFVGLVGAPVVPLLVAGAIFVLGYTDVFARVALGEIAAGLGLGGLPVLGVVLVQDGTVGPVALAVAVPASILTFELLLLNEFPDQTPDRRGGRQNLLHVFGRRRAAWLYVLAGLAVPLSIAGFVFGGVLPPLALLGTIPSALLARPFRWALARPTASVPVAALRDNVVWMLATNVALAVGLALSMVI